MKKLFLALLFILPFSSQSKRTDTAYQLPSLSLQYIEKNPYKIAAAATIAALGTAWYCCNDYEERWDWNTIILGDHSFPTDFKWGVATSDLQMAGIQTAGNKRIENSWTKGEQEKNIPEEQRMGIACGHWNKYEEDFALARDFGLDIFRYSIEWSKIQPNAGQEFDHAAMQHYIEYTKALLAYGLEPMPTLFHHAWPLWFDDLGAWEKEENIHYFVDYALYVFDAFQQAGLLEHTKMWLTFNEPAGYTLGAYLHGKYPPHQKNQFKLAGIVLKNMLDAHVNIYRKFKKLDPSLQISLAHVMQPMQAYNPWNPLDQVIIKIVNHLLNNVTLEYLSTGKFDWLIFIHATNDQAKDALDFLGINYYTHTLLSILSNPKVQIRANEIVSDEGNTAKSIYAEGFYQMLKIAAQYFPQKSIFITENGFATNDCNKNKTYIDHHLYVIKKALNEGINIMGYLWWTFLECFSWGHGNGSQYGLYHVDFSDKENLPRTLKDSSKYLQEIIARNKARNNFPEFFQKEIALA